uniref:Putative serine/threonine-protein kinase mark-a n=1 Tax=Corethrella appendiculata TaxID=1370023 RepID=U5EQ23_9DIPT
MKYNFLNKNIDLDIEQSEARYDPGMLSELANDEQSILQKAEPCTIENVHYDHGQKIVRNDPCEICLCIDGEIFCWWKQCVVEDDDEEDEEDEEDDYIDEQKYKKHNQQQKHHHQKLKQQQQQQKQKQQHRSAKQQHMKPIYTTSQMDSTTSVSSSLSIPQNILSFPQTPPVMFKSSLTMQALNLTERTSKELPNYGVGGGGSEKYKSSKYKKLYKKLKNSLNIKDTTLLSDKKYIDKAIKTAGAESTSTIVATVTSLTSSSSQATTTTLPIQTISPTIATSSDSNSNNNSSINSTKSSISTETSTIDINGEDETFKFNSNNIQQQQDKPQHYIITSSGNVEMYDNIEQHFDRIDEFAQASSVASSSNLDTIITTTIEVLSPSSDTVSGVVNNMTQQQQQLNFNKSDINFVDINSTQLIETDFYDYNNQNQTDTIPVSSKQQQQNEKFCIVMGESYKIGSIIKQETGNCLQCVCIDGTENDPQPRVTCTPQNCPPLILPDILDGTGF